MSDTNVSVLLVLRSFVFQGLDGDVPSFKTEQQQQQQTT